MSTENQVATTAETQTAAEDITNQPEVVIPEVTVDTGLAPASTEAPAKTAEQLAQENEQLRRAIADRDRKITKRDRTQGKLHLELQQLRQRVDSTQTRAQAAETEEEAVAIKPAELEQVVQREAVARAEVIADQRAFVARCNTVASEGKKQFADFPAALNTLIEEAGPIVDPQTGIKTILGEQILEADAPAALIHYLGKNPELAAELEGLSPGRLARKLASIEAQMNAKPKTSSAPKPLEPLKPAASSAGLSDDLSADEWRRRRDAEVRKRNGR